MAFVKIRVPRTSQPQDACGIDWGSPYAQYAVAAWAGRKTPTDALGNAMVWVGAGIEERIGQDGYQQYQTGATSSLGYWLDKNIGKFGTDDFFIQVKLTSAATSSTSSFLGKGDTGAAEWMFGSANTATQVRFYGAGGAMAVIATSAVAAGALRTVSATRVDGELTVWVDGVSRGLDSASANDLSDTAHHLTIGGGDYDGTTFDNSRNYIGGLSQVIVLRGIGGADVAGYFYDKPWQLFEPEEQLIWVPDAVGAGGTDHLVTPASSQQPNTASAGAITQTHLIGAAHSTQANTAGGASVWQTHQVGASSSTQANVGTAGSVSQGSITQVTAANSTQPNTASAGSIAQTHQVGAASSSTGHTGTAAAVSQTHLISAASSQQANTATAGSVSQSGAQTASAANSVQANTASAGGISQTHLIVCAPVAVDNVASASSIVQTHLIGAANSVQGNVASGASVSDGSAAAFVAAADFGVVPYELRTGHVPFEDRVGIVPFESRTGVLQ